MESEPLVPLRMLTELVYCERLYHFMAVQGVMVQSADTIEGSTQHARVESRSGRKRPAIQTTPEDPPWPLPRQYHLESEALGVVGRLDAVESWEGALIPVEAKHGPDVGRRQAYAGNDLQTGAWDGDQIQLVGQILLLESAGYPTAHGEIYYRGSHQRVAIARTPSLEVAFRTAVDRAVHLRSQPLPDPLLDSPKCIRCSLASVCLPDETNLLKHRCDEPRRILPARPDGGVLYLATPGLSLGKDGEKLVIRDHGAEVDSIPLKDVIQVVAFGQGVQVSTQALHFLLDNGRTYCHLSRAGRLLGMTAPLSTQNVALRQAQFLKFSLPELRLAIGRSLVSAKIRNQRTFLRRNHPGSAMLDTMRDLAGQAETASDSDSLLGIEGIAARHYFHEFPGMLIAEWRPHMIGRSRRPPRDGVNAALSFVYMLLAREAAVVLAQVGLDPMFGAFHVMRPGRPALALDLMEPFRPLIADSVVLRALNTLALAPSDLHTTPAGVFLSDAGRKTILTAYERRLGELVTHPAFGYRLSYRRVIELEARMLARWLEGDIGEWKPLVTR